DKQVVHLDDERRAAMVSKLMVVLCGGVRSASDREHRNALYLKGLRNGGTKVFPSTLELRTLLRQQPGSTPVVGEFHISPESGHFHVLLRLPMRDLFVLLVHLTATLFRLARPGGVRAVVAESVLMKHQLLIVNRSRQRAPNLRVLDRLVAGFCSLWIK